MGTSAPLNENGHDATNYGPVEDVTMDGHGVMIDDGMFIVDTRKQKFHYVRAPAGLPGIKKGTKLKVLRTFMSDERCPLGTGLVCLEIEWGIKAVFTGSKGIAWLRDRNNTATNC